MQGPGGVLLNDKNELVPLWPQDWLRFGSLLELSFGFVFL